MKATCVLITVFAVGMCATVVKSQESTSVSYKVFSELKSYQMLDLGRYAKNYAGCLEFNGCNEIVESGLAQVAMIKLAQPAAEMNALRQKVDDLMLRGETPAIRYKAYLTSMVFEHPDLFVYEKYGSYNDGNELFSALALRMQQAALVAR